MNNMGIDIKGWVKISDPVTNTVLVDKSNAIHYENFSEALAKSIVAGPLNANDSESASGFIKTISFGNGGTDVSPTGAHRAVARTGVRFVHHGSFSSNHSSNSASLMSLASAIRTSITKLRNSLSVLNNWCDRRSINRFIRSIFSSIIPPM